MYGAGLPVTTRPLTPTETIQRELETNRQEITQLNCSAVLSTASFVGNYVLLLTLPALILAFGGGMKDAGARAFGRSLQFGGAAMGAVLTLSYPITVLSQADAVFARHKELVKKNKRLLEMLQGTVAPPPAYNPAYPQL